MYLSRHNTASGLRWAVDGKRLADDFSLSRLLSLDWAEMEGNLAEWATDQEVSGDPAAPLDPHQEVWAAGVTYRRSKSAREEESDHADAYTLVYGAQRPELFFKALGWRVVEHLGTIRVRADSTWDVPEPELTLVVNSSAQVVGYTAGNDVSSRSIEGQNTLYLPQAKMYDGSCALGPGIVLCPARELGELPITLRIRREGREIYSGVTSTAEMRRGLEELTGYLFRELSFPHGAFLLTGTGLVPDEPFTLLGGDEVEIGVGELTLINRVA